MLLQLMMVVATVNLPAHASPEYKELYEECDSVSAPLVPFCGKDMMACQVKSQEELATFHKALLAMAEINERLEKETLPLIQKDMSIENLADVIALNSKFCAIRFPYRAWDAVISSKVPGRAELESDFLKYVLAPSPTLDKSRMKNSLLIRAVENGFIKVKSRPQAVKELEGLRQWFDQQAESHFKTYQAEVASAGTWRRLEMKIDTFVSYLKGRFKNNEFWDKEYARKEMKDLALAQESAARRAALLEKFKN